MRGHHQWSDFQTDSREDNGTINYCRNYRNRRDVSHRDSEFSFEEVEFDILVAYPCSHVICVIPGQEIRSGFRFDK